MVNLMETYGKLFEDNRLGFTVYTPDTVQSHLIGNIDHHIQLHTGLTPGFRQWIRHDVASLTAFYGGEVTEETKTKTLFDYENVPFEDVQYGHLFTRFSLMGGALVTFWQGDAAIEKLLAIKGKTDPAESPANTIRGSFWCDNAICNLSHCSDDLVDAERELNILKLTQVFEQKSRPTELFPAIDDPRPFVTHSAIYHVSQLVNRLLLNDGIAPIEAALLASHDSKDNMSHLIGVLESVMQDYPRTDISLFIEHYLEGHFVDVSIALQTMPVSRWESLMIQCGVITRDKWNSGRLS